ncbi:MAG: hypothetical protein IJX78_05945 [Bacilli bacterium]|nr:hypothetical protein [Bacilli bacterium]
MNIKKMLICLCFLFCLVSLTSCKEIETYDDMKTITYEKILSKSNLSASGTYYVIVHRNGCAVCEGIMPKVAEYANLSGIDPIYALNKSDKKNNGGISPGSGVKVNVGLGATNYEDIKLASSPVLLKITNGKVVKLIDTRTNILAELEAMIAKNK